LRDGGLVAALEPGAALLVEGESGFEDVEVVAAVRSRHRIACRFLVEPALERGLVDDVGQLERRLNLREVDEHARGRGDRDALEARHVPRIEVLGPMEPDAREISALAKDNDIDHRGAKTDEPAQLGGREEAEQRAFAAGEHSREKPGLTS
jgi:hypothetical protein